MKKPALSRRLLFTVFTLSGFSGLIYESIWSHYLKLFLGHAAYAQTLVLAIFMGGMALGAWLVSRNTARIKNLLVGYALVELLTGVLALVFHRVYVGSLDFSYDTVIPALGGATSIGFFKWTLAALLILPQSILLGTTFPLISSGVIRRFPEKSGETLAMLYFTNSLGAALGVLASGFWLIAAVGLPGTVMTAGIMNVLLALFVWVIARDQEVPAPAASPPAPATSVLSRAILVAAFLAGMAAFVYEIAWIRMLSLVLGSSTHAFELMLSAFILGLAFGGYWVRKRIDSFPNVPRALAIMFALMAILGAATLPAYGFMFDVMAKAMQTFTSSEPGYAGFNVTSHLIAAVMMIPTTLIAGMTLPLMTHYLLREGAGEQAIGKVYAANTVGAIVGVLAAIHLMLPFIGTKGAVVLAALVQLVISFLFLRQGETGERTHFSLGTAAVSALVILVIAATVKLDPNRMASGVYRHGQVRVAPDSEVVYLRDGKTATITLTKTGHVISIATNGKPDAAINMEPDGAAGPDEITMVLAGALPMAMHPDPQRIANIGIGSGLTSELVLLTSPTATLDSIEIEPAIAEAARIGFHPRVQKLFKDPRSHIYFEDAKTFFASRKQPYDIIISEPSNPWVSGVASLFSGEFYTQVKRYLADDGLLVQWVQIYETDMTVVASILKALSPHFNDYVIYNTDSTNILIVASPTGRVPPVRDEVLAANPAAELRRVGIEAPSVVGLHRLGSKKILDPLFQSYAVPANSDYFPFVDLTAPKMRYLRRRASVLSDLPLLSVPVMELLGEPAPPANQAISADENFLMRQVYVQRALTLRNAMQSGDYGTLSSEDRKELLMLNATQAQCEKKGVPIDWLTTVSQLSEKLTPFLPAEELAPLWQGIRKSPCYPLNSQTGQALLAFFEVVALRQRDAIISQGIALLEDPKKLSPAMQSSAILAVSAALLGGSDPQAGVKFLQQHGDYIDANRQDSLPVRLVSSVAAMQQKSAAAGSGSAANK